MPLKPNRQIWKAIEQRRMMRLVYHDKERIIEPHDHGILNGSVQLLAWQVAGFSSRPLPNWLRMKVDEIAGLTTLPDMFPEGRPTGSGRHTKWDKLFIRVKPADEGADAVPEQKTTHPLAFDSMLLTQLCRKLTKITRPGLRCGSAMRTWLGGCAEAAAPTRAHPVPAASRGA